MTHGEKIALEAMQREHKRLSKIADKAKAEAEESLGITDEAFAIHKEFSDIVKAKDHSAETVKRLSCLAARQKRVDTILKKSLVKLLDKQSDAERNRDLLLHEIRKVEWKSKRLP